MLAISVHFGLFSLHCLGFSILVIRAQSCDVIFCSSVRFILVRKSPMSSADLEIAYRSPLNFIPVFVLLRLSDIATSIGKSLIIEG